jgi:hypothetical protein
MDDDRLLLELEQHTSGHDDPSRIAHDQLIEQILQGAESFHLAMQCERPLAALRRADGTARRLLELNRQIAPTLGARGPNASRAGPAASESCSLSISSPGSKPTCGKLATWMCRATRRSGWS